MGIGIVFNIINSKILRNKMVSEIGKIYFNNFEKLNALKRDKNYFSLMNKKKLENIKLQLLFKCNFVNILFEISRL